MILAWLVLCLVHELLHLVECLLVLRQMVRAQLVWGLLSRRWRLLWLALQSVQRRYLVRWHFYLLQVRSLLLGLLTGLSRALLLRARLMPVEFRGGRGATCRQHFQVEIPFALVSTARHWAR